MKNSNYVLRLEIHIDRNIMKTGAFSHTTQYSAFVFYFAEPNWNGWESLLAISIIEY